MKYYLHAVFPQNQSPTNPNQPWNGYMDMEVGVETEERTHGTCAFRHLARSLPTPSDATRAELAWALSIYERAIGEPERQLLIRMASHLYGKGMDLLLFLVAIMRHLAQKLRVDFRSLSEIIARRGTIVELLLEVR